MFDEGVEKIKKLLSKGKIQYATITRGPGKSYLITLTTGEEILLTSDETVLRHISSLQVILSRLTMDGRRVKRLDFRYDKPVITYK